MWGWNIGLVVVPSKWVSFQEEGRDGVTGWTCSQWDLFCTVEKFIWLLTKSLSLFNEKPHKHRNLSVWLLPLIDFCANSYQLIKHSPNHLTHPQSKYGHDKKKSRNVCMKELSGILQVSWIIRIRGMNIYSETLKNTLKPQVLFFSFSEEACSLK